MNSVVRNCGNEHVYRTSFSSSFETVLCFLRPVHPHKLDLILSVFNRLNGKLLDVYKIKVWLSLAYHPDASGIRNLYVWM